MFKFVQVCMESGRVAGRGRRCGMLEGRGVVRTRLPRTRVVWAFAVAQAGAQRAHRAGRAQRCAGWWRARAGGVQRGWQRGRPVGHIGVYFLFV